MLGTQWGHMFFVRAQYFNSSLSREAGPVAALNLRAGAEPSKKGCVGRARDRTTQSKPTPSKKGYQDQSPT